MNLQKKEELFAKFEELPLEKQEEVIDFVEFLNSKRNNFESSSRNIIHKPLEKDIVPDFKDFYAKRKFDLSNLKASREEMNER